MDTVVDWPARAAGVKHDLRSWIDGRAVPGAGAVYVKHNPASEEVLWEAPSGGASLADAAVASARRAFEDGRWRNLSPLERKARLTMLAQLIERDAQELALIDSLEVGKAISHALHDPAMATGLVRYAAESIDKLNSNVVPSEQRVLALNLYEPVGVVAAIAAWNYPLVLAAMKIGPALAAGNCIVFKPSELTPSSALRFARLAQEAGIPDGVVNVVWGLGEDVGAQLAQHMDVDMLTFTGSTATGGKLMQAAGLSNLKKLMLECGGKSPHIVLADTPDLDAAAADVAGSICMNQGQICVAGSRLIVEERIAEELLEAVAHRLRSVEPGDPLDESTTFGPLISAAHLERVSGFVERARAAGARVTLGGERPDRKGFFFTPALVRDAAADSEIARLEVFGPVLTVFCVPTMDAALELAHRSSYGLSARVWTGDAAKGLAFVRRMRAGEIAVNVGAPAAEGAGFAISTEPFGQSGFGAESGMAGVRAYTRLKAAVVSLPA